MSACRGGEQEDIAWYKLTDVSEVLTASIITLMMETVNASKTSIKTYENTYSKIPKNIHLQTGYTTNAY
jgi:hypothetical protein